MAELAIVDDPSGPGELPCPSVEVAHDRRPVVLRDVRDQCLRQARPVSQVDAVHHVLLEDPGAHFGLELVVDVLASGLVLDERQRVGELADVVVIGGNASHQLIRADRLRGALGEIPDHQRVVVGAGRLDQQPAQQRLRRIGKLQELEDGQDSEHRPEDGERADGGDPRAGPRRHRRERELQDATQVACAEQREDGDDERVDDEHGYRGLEEDLQPVALSNADGPGHPAQEDVGRVLERCAVDRPTDEGDERHHDRRYRGINKHRQEHRDGRRGQEERQGWPTGRDLERQGCADDQQTDQDQDVVAMPQLRAEAPDPAEEHDDHEDGEQQPTGEAGKVGHLFAQSERIDLFDLGGIEPRALADQHFTLEDLHADIVDRLRGTVPGLGGQLRAERRVGDKERTDQLARQHSLRLVEPAGHPAGESGPGFGDLGIAQLSAQRGVEHPRRLRSDRGPASCIEADQRGLRAVRQVRDGRLEQRRTPVGGEVRGKRRVDPDDPLLERELLLLRDGDGVLAREVVLRLDGRACCGARLGRPDDADEVDRPGGRDVAWSKLSGTYLERLVGQDVRPKDGGKRDDQDQRRDREARRVAPREPSEGGSAGGQHGVSPGLSALRRRARQGRRSRAPGRRAR